MRLMEGVATALAVSTIVALGAAGCKKEDRRACHIEVTQAEKGGFDARAVVDGGTFPEGTVFTGHGRYQGHMRDGWPDYTPPDFSVAMGQPAHLEGTTHDPEHPQESLHLVSVDGTLDPKPGRNDSRTDCGATILP